MEDEAFKTEEMQLSEGQTTRIARNLLEDSKTKLENLPPVNKDPFAYSSSDMPGINPNMIEHSKGKAH